MLAVLKFSEIFVVTRTIQSFRHYLSSRIYPISSRTAYQPSLVCPRVSCKISAFTAGFSKGDTCTLKLNPDYELATKSH